MKIPFSFPYDKAQNPYGEFLPGCYSIAWHEHTTREQQIIMLTKLYNILEENFNVQWQSKIHKENFNFKNKEDEDYFLLWGSNGVDIEI
jgi:protein tyrosine phosphatase